MPAKKTPAKKTTTRRTSAAKKTTAAKTKSTRTPSRATAAKKDLAYENLREDELTTQYPAMKRNNFLSLIVLALGTIFVLIGIYVQVTKEDPQNTDLPINTGNNTTVVTETGSSTVSSGNISTTGETPSAPTTTYATFPVDAQNMVQQFYTYFNDDQFNNISSLYDNNFTSVPGLRQYFNPTRLQNRKLNIIGDMNISEVNAVIDHPIVQRNPNAMVVQYKTSYTLKQDGKPYSETWFAYVVRGNGTFKLNGFECQENCAASPFFQLR